ncbi:hypothetical protein MHZ93_23360 [Roseomonas sp. ACRSG]|nr:hypothetical protein [Roseomonas sp. ACRSG]
MSPWPVRETKKPTKHAVKGGMQGAGRLPKRTPKLTVRQAQELVARWVTRRKVLLVVGGYALRIVMLVGAFWWLAVFLEKR